MCINHNCSFKIKVFIFIILISLIVFPYFKDFIFQNKTNNEILLLARYKAKDESGKWVYGNKFKSKPYDDPYMHWGKYLVNDESEIRVKRYTISPLVAIHNEKPLYFGDIIKIKNLPWIYNEKIEYYAVVYKYQYKASSKLNETDKILTTTMKVIDLFNNDTVTLWTQNESYSAKNEISANNQPDGSMAIFAYSFIENSEKKTESLKGRKIFKFNSEECSEDILQSGCISNIPKGATVERLGNIWDNETLLKKLSGGNLSNDFTLDICEYDLDIIGEKF